MKIKIISCWVSTSYGAYADSKLYHHVENKTRLLIRKVDEMIKVHLFKNSNHRKSPHIASISIKIGSRIATGTLYSSGTSCRFLKLLPLVSNVKLWGEEIFFKIPLYRRLQFGAVSQVEIGDIAYSARFNCLCIFIGPTPISYADRIIPNGPVNILGRITCGLERFRGIRDNEKILIENA